MTAAVTRDADAAVTTSRLSRAAAWGLGGVVIAAFAFAFVGLSAEGYWTDELFTLFLVNHHGGAAEVWRRALTDTHPPLYYLLLYGWAQVFGLSEPALRALSGLFCIGAVAALALGTRRAFTLNGRLFAAAVAVTSPFWFMQSQNVRNYALCLLATSILAVLAIRARASQREGGTVPASVVAGLALAGAVGAFSHFYAFLATGLLYLYLILTVPSRRLRVSLILAGAAIFAVEVAYMRLLMRTTQQNTHDMWFRADAPFFAHQTFEALQGLIAPGALAAIVALALTAPWRGQDRIPPRDAARRDTGWIVGLGAFTVGGVIAAGIAISLAFAPSYSNMNLLIAGPFLWPALALGYDAATARRSGAVAAIGLTVPVIALVVQLATQAERWLPRGEAWRESASLVMNQRGCAGQPIPVLLPARFGPPTPFFRGLAQRDFYGFYFAGQAARLVPYRADELVDPARNPTLRARLSPGACPVVAWAVHDINRAQAQALADSLSRAAGAEPGAVQVVGFETYRPVWTWPKPIQASFVFIRRRP